VPRWALLRVLLFLVDAAKRASQASQQGIATLQLHSADGAVQVRASAQDAVSVYAAEMASICGGSLQSENGVLVLVLPSLTEVRRRERTAGLR